MAVAEAQTLVVVEAQTLAVAEVHVVVQTADALAQGEVTDNNNLFKAGCTQPTACLFNKKYKKI